MIYIYCDGGVHHNQTPNKREGYATIYVTTKEHPNHADGLLLKKTYDLGNVTNNQAEYLAINRALSYCVDEFIPDAVIYSDSELVVNQLSGKYAVKNEELKALHDPVKRYLQLYRATLIKINRTIIESVLGH